MKGTVQQKTPVLLAVLIPLLLGMGFFLFNGKTTAVQAGEIRTQQTQTAPPAPTVAATPTTPTEKPDNSQCLICHSAPNQVMTFANGDTVSVTVDSDRYDHGEHVNMACQICHPNITRYPHPENPAQSAREYTLQYENSCNQCHPDQARQTMDNAHARERAEGNPNTPTCSSCHNPHYQPAIQKDANGDPLPVEHKTITETCAKCHGQIVDEYKNSVHGKALFEENNEEVPSCVQCHGIHNMRQASTIEFRLNSPQLCANCHTRSDIMDKYGISTNVLNTYVDDFHGTTIMLFAKTDPNRQSNKPVCYDCHGVHDIASVDDPQRGLEIKQNMLATCQKCHPDATKNFPASWMSHYIASPTRYPLVYYVNLFYQFFIPTVLGVMAIFVLSDVFRRGRGLSGRLRQWFARRKNTPKKEKPKGGAA